MLAPALAFTVASAVAAAASLQTGIPTRLTVQLIRRCPPGAICSPPDVVRAMKREAERIWTALGVQLDWIELSSSTPASHPTADLVVMLEEHPNPVVEGSDPGSLVLGRMHKPTTPCDAGVAHLWVAHVRHQIESVYVNGLPLISVPTRFGQDLLARALGRTLAHEVGHYLLGGTHARYGLMRPQFSAQQLVETLGEYDLDAASRRTLMARTQRLRQCVPATIIE